MLFLGTGTSHGVPMIGCTCDVCRSSDPRDRRNRPSAVLTSQGVSLLIDTPPELRVSCLALGISRVDAVLFTHHHADHLLGLDDVRRFNEINGAPIECYASARCLQEIRQTFRYAFGSDHVGGGVPSLKLVEVSGRFSVCGLTVEPLTVLHGPTPVLGYRVGDFAYVTDVKTVPDEAVERLTGLDTLVLGVLRHRPHPTHLSVSEALDLLERLQPRRAFFTHIAHDLGHESTESALPKGVRMAYDGLVVRVGG